MTVTQIFKWFCKEQKIMHIIQEMYYVIRPYSILYQKDGGLLTKYLSFDEYITSKAKSFGFSFLLERMSNEYMNKLRGEMSYEEYWNKRDEWTDKLSEFCRKWEYFAKHNIIFTDEILKVGDKVKYKSWGRRSEITIDKIDIYHSLVYGTGGEVNGFSCQVYFAELINDDETPMEINFSIKRKRKIYNGKN